MFICDLGLKEWFLFRGGNLIEGGGVLLVFFLINCSFILVIEFLIGNKLIILFM